MTTEITSAAANADLVRAGFEVFNTGDVDRCLALIAPDLIINLAELPEPQHGRETHRRVRQPRVLPHRGRALRRGMDLLGHGHPVPPAQLSVAAGERRWRSPGPAARRTTAG
jgi:ketosteroid isomerase-like protein